MSVKWMSLTRTWPAERQAPKLRNVGGFTMIQETKGRGRGFASMSPDKQRLIASKGGRAAHEVGTVLATIE